MNKRWNRSVNVSLSSNGLIIGLMHFDSVDEQPSEFKSMFLDYPKCDMLESVEKAINILVGDWERVFVSDGRLSVIAMIREEDNDLYDFVVSAEEPEQAFISRYVLDYHMGETAHFRNTQRTINTIMSLRFGKAGV